MIAWTLEWVILHARMRSHNIHIFCPHPAGGCAQLERDVTGWTRAVWVYPHTPHPSPSTSLALRVAADTTAQRRNIAIYKQSTYTCIYCIHMPLRKRVKLTYSTRLFVIVRGEELGWLSQQGVFNAIPQSVFDVCWGGGGEQLGACVTEDPFRLRYGT